MSCKVSAAATRMARFVSDQAMATHATRSTPIVRTTASGGLTTGAGSIGSYLACRRNWRKPHTSRSAASAEIRITPPASRIGNRDDIGLAPSRARARGHLNLYSVCSSMPIFRTAGWMS
jgi:hypothetical protein